MHRSELESTVRCAVCGALTYGEQDRSYVFDLDDALCYSCAAQLGGVYSEEEGRWVEAPEVPPQAVQPPS